ncbi:hypothetical protein ACOSQ3_003424 [Xanthoceras sorbifolium]
MPSTIYISLPIILVEETFLVSPYKFNTNPILKTLSDNHFRIPISQDHLTLMKYGEAEPVFWPQNFGFLFRLLIGDSEAFHKLLNQAVDIFHFNLQGSFQIDCQQQHKTSYH